MRRKFTQQLFKNPIDQIIVLLALALTFILFAYLGSLVDDSEPVTRIYTMRVAYTVIEPEQYDYPEVHLATAYYRNWYMPNHLIHETETRYELEYTYLGYYYCTAYSPQETGSWGTASGTTLHRADYENRLTEPTTCAIDRSLHRFGDLFYIPAFDRVFVAEDTGSAVKGNHLDLGYTDLESVWSFPTGSYEVYAVEYVPYEVEIEYYDFAKERGVMRRVYLENRYRTYDRQREDTEN